eukprot:UN29828
MFDVLGVVGCYLDYDNISDCDSETSSTSKYYEMKLDENDICYEVPSTANFIIYRFYYHIDKVMYVCTSCLWADCVGWFDYTVPKQGHSCYTKFEDVTTSVQNGYCPRDDVHIPTQSPSMAPTADCTAVLEEQPCQEKNCIWVNNKGCLDVCEIRNKNIVTGYFTDYYYTLYQCQQATLEND